MNKQQRIVLGRVNDDVSRIRTDLETYVDSIDGDTISRDDVNDQFKGFGACILELQEKVTEIRDDEQDKLDNMPDNFRDGDKGEELEQIISDLSDAIDELGYAIDSLEIYESDQDVDHVDAAANADDNLERVADAIEAVI